MDYLHYYLPYRVKCFFVNKPDNAEHGTEVMAELIGLYSNNEAVFADTVESSHGFKDIRLALRPLDEQAFNRMEKEIEAMGLYSDNIAEYIATYKLTHPRDREEFTNQAPHIFMKWCFENHYDVFCIIGTEYASDASHLNLWKS